MRSTSILGFALALTLAACGGKIEGDPAPFIEPPSPTLPPETSPPSPSSSSSPPSGPTKSTVEDACKTICDRNGQCGALQVDCHARCTEDIQTAIACGPEAATYIHCYADNLDGCSPLPPLCEDAYCAFTRCAGRVVPRYCH